MISNDFLNSDSINKKNYTPNKIEICLLEGDNKINTVIITRNNFIGNPPDEEFKLYDIGNNSIDSIDLLKEEIIFKTFVGEPFTDIGTLCTYSINSKGNYKFINTIIHQINK
jgi:hypothetical protein